jgi:hypothetical protein
MSTSSAQTISSITLDDILTDTITLTSGSSYDTVTIDPNYSYQYTTGNTFSIGGGGGTYTISGPSTINTTSINISDFKVTMPEEWVDCFPDFDRIEKMCKEYPGLKIAYEQFKTVYALVRDDYDTPKDQRVKP